MDVKADSPGSALRRRVQPPKGQAAMPTASRAFSVDLFTRLCPPGEQRHQHFPTAESTARAHTGDSATGTGPGK